MSQNNRKIKICFVCHGNICRSPFAAALAKKDVRKKGWSDHVLIDSAGTSREHIGENSHPLSIKIGHKRGLTMDHKARQFTDNEFQVWDYIILMDRNNKKNLQKLPSYKGYQEKVTLLRDWDEYATSQFVPDPWGYGEEAYEEMAEIISSAIVEFIDHLAHKYNNFKS